jgi:hypothetical protein
MRRIQALLIAAAILAGSAAVWKLSARGVDFVWIKRLNLLLALAAAAVMLTRAARRGRGAPGPAGRGAIVVLAALALVGYLNFFSFHGERTWIHLHDVAHYYLGSKYHAELGYADLYTGMLRAEAESHGNRFKAVEARDLRTYEQVHIRDLLRESDRVKAAFTRERWEAFREDVDFFRSRLGPGYGTLLLDHGFNPTPVWALIGGWLANLVPAGSHSGILALTLIDPLLIAASMGMIAWAFGAEAALLAFLQLCIMFGATFGWTGGAFMRYPWLFGVIASICLLKKRRSGLAGAALALAAAMRIFPVFFAMPMLFKAAGRVVGALAGPDKERARRLLPPPRYLRYFGGLAAGLMLLVSATALLPAGLGAWSGFRENISTHVQTISPNMVGLTEPLAFRPGAGNVTREEFRELKDRRQRIHAAQALFAFLPVLLLAGAASLRLTDWSASALLPLPLLYTGLSLASYYYVFLVLVTCAWRRRPALLALLFAAEAAPYAAMLLGGGEAILHIVRGLALVPVSLLILLPPALRQWAAVTGGGDRRAPD